MMTYKENLIDYLEKRLDVYNIWLKTTKDSDQYKISSSVIYELTTVLGIVKNSQGGDDDSNCCKINPQTANAVRRYKVECPKCWGKGVI